MDLISLPTIVVLSYFGSLDCCGLPEDVTIVLYWKIAAFNKLFPEKILVKRPKRDQPISYKLLNRKTELLDEHGTQFFSYRFLVKLHSLELNISNWTW